MFLAPLSRAVVTPVSRCLRAFHADRSIRISSGSSQPSSTAVPSPGRFVWVWTSTNPGRIVPLGKSRVSGSGPSLLGRSFAAPTQEILEPSRTIAPLSMGEPPSASMSRLPVMTFVLFMFLPLADGWRKRRFATLITADASRIIRQPRRSRLHANGSQNGFPRMRKPPHTSLATSMSSVCRQGCSDQYSEQPQNGPRLPSLTRRRPVSQRGHLRAGAPICLRLSD